MNIGKKENRQESKRMRDAKTHLDTALDYLIGAIERNGDQETSINRAGRTVSKAIKLIYELAWSLDEETDRNWSRKRINASVPKASSAHRSLEKVREVVEKMLEFSIVVFESSL